jgi:hypothetical protein
VGVYVNPALSTFILGLARDRRIEAAVIINRSDEMLRSIFQGIAAGMRKAFGYAFGIVTLPFRLFGGGGRRSMPGLDMDAVKQAKAAVTNSGLKATDLVQSRMRDSQRDSQIAWTWVMGSLLLNKTQPFPPALSRTMKSWLQGLDHAQLVVLKNAGAKGVFEHSFGNKKLPMVPLVKPLAPVTIKYPTPRIRKPADEVAELRLTPAA